MFGDNVVRPGKGAARTLPILTLEDLDREQELDDADDEFTGLEAKTSARVVEPSSHMDALSLADHPEQFARSTASPPSDSSPSASASGGIRARLGHEHDAARELGKGASSSSWSSSSTGSSLSGTGGGGGGAHGGGAGGTAAGDVELVIATEVVQQQVAEASGSKGAGVLGRRYASVDVPAEVTICVMALSSYSECFMRTDSAEPVATRSLSEAMLETIKHHMKVKGYSRPLAVRFKLPAAKRRPDIEDVIIQRIAETAHVRYHLAITTIIKDIAWGMASLIFSYLVLFLCGHVDEYITVGFQRIFWLYIIAVSLWWINWQGFDYLFYVQRSHWGALKFFKALRFSRVTFVDA